MNRYWILLLKIIVLWAIPLLIFLRAYALSAFTTSPAVAGFIAGLCLVGPVVSFCLIKSSIAMEKSLKAKIAYRQNLEAVSQLRDSCVKSLVKTAVRGENVRIADQLHDQTLGSLSCLHIQLDSFLQMKSPDMNQLAETKDLVKHTYEELRDVVTALKHERSEDDKLDFLLDLEHLMMMILKPLSIEIQFKIGDLKAINSFNFDMQMELFRFFKECVNNVVKHAEATKVVLEINADDLGLHCSVSDNGRGFDPETTPSNGLTRLEARVKKYMGQFQITSSKQSGTTVQFSFPNTQIQ